MAAAGRAASATMRPTSATCSNGVRLQVGAAVALADRNRHDDAVRAGRVGVLRALQVGRQRHHGQAGQQPGAADDFGGVRHLRDQRRRHEAADLDLAQAGGGDGGDPARLGGGRHDGLGHLQPVARADLADRHRLAHRRLRLSPAASVPRAGSQDCRNGARTPRPLVAARSTPPTCRGAVCRG